LLKLKAQGFHLSVASSKTEDTAKEILEHFGLDRYFEVIAGSDPKAMDSSKEEVIGDALNRLFHYRMIKKALVIMVGDRCFDVDAAKETGLSSVAVRYGYAPEGELEESQPDYIVSTVEELEKLLLSKELQGEDFVVKEAEPEPEDDAETAGAEKKAGDASIGSGSEKEASTRRMDPKYFSTDDRKTGGGTSGDSSGQRSGAGSTQNPTGSAAGSGAAAGGSGDWKADAKKQRSRSFQTIWAFLYPFLLFYVMGELARQLLGYVVLFLSQSNDALFNFLFILEDSDEEGLSFSGNGSAIVQILALVVVFFILYYMADGRKCLSAAKGKYGQNPKQKQFVWVVTTLLLALGINMFFIGTGRLRVRRSYKEAAANLYAVGIPLGIILYGFFSSTVEEFLFRGIILLQMDRYMKPNTALLLSALLFGVYHGNLVQGIYAFAIGAVLGMAYRDSGSFVLIAAIHGLVNVIVFLMSNLGLFPTGTAGITSGAVLIAMGVICLEMVIRREKIHE
ncbi:MAG: HAD hydrolase-like protein, partial [Lachnospiraceae bacterium]|nr:HAD hydrolase-like protein [Lachnospiraceae bacterium]